MRKLIFVVLAMAFASAALTGCRVEGELDDHASIGLPR